MDNSQPHTTKQVKQLGVLRKVINRLREEKGDPLDTKVQFRILLNKLGSKELL